MIQLEYAGYPHFICGTDDPVRFAIPNDLNVFFRLIDPK
jgi:hypothetical protein